MNNASYIAVHRLIASNASLMNRNDVGEQKLIRINGVDRARLSSQSKKRVIRKRMNMDTIRSSHMADCVERILQEFFAADMIQEDQIQPYGKVISNILDSSWDKRDSLEKKNDDGKGRTVVVIRPAELRAIVDAVLECDPKDKKFETAAKAKALKALEGVKLTADKAMFGCMVASETSTQKTVYGSVSLTHSYGVNEYVAEDDYITAAFAGPVPFYGSDDPFKAGLDSFVDAQSKQARAQTIASSTMSSNVFYDATVIDIAQLMSNLEQSAVLTKLADCPVEQIQDLLVRYVETFATAMPDGKQRSNLTEPMPSILYFECHRDGTQPRTMDPQFAQVIDNTGDVTGEAIRRMLNGIRDNIAFNGIYKGDVTRYVWLSSAYESFRPEFEELGVKVLRNFAEIDAMISEETERVIS